jgi:hypothetical protein
VEALRGVAGKPARLTFGDEPLRRIEAGEIVKQPRKARLSRIGAMPLREEVGAARNAHAMREPVLLSQIFFNAPYQLCERGHQSPKLARNTPSRLR